MDFIIHDFKSERQGVSGGLPASLKIVPIAFYITAVAAALLSLYFTFSIRAYKKETEVLQRQLTDYQAETSRIQADEAKLHDIAEKASHLGEWLEGARPIQPITVAVGRSMSKNSTIAELSLNRNPEIPAHTFLELKINGGGSLQVESTLNAIYALNYQTYSAQQVKAKNATDFQATLIYNDSE